MNILKWSTWWATLGPIGYLPAPGTFGSLCALLLVPMLGAATVEQQALTLTIFFFCGWVLINRARYAFVVQDPSAIVLDEVVGCLIAFFALPLSWPVVLLGFVTFRLLDIYKPLGIRHCENFYGAWGILLDDVAAGVLTNIFLRIVLYGYANPHLLVLSDLY